MEFLKNFFNDDSKIIGLCGFDLEKPYYSKNTFTPPVFKTDYKNENIFETKFNENVFLSL